MPTDNAIQRHIIPSKTTWHARNLNGLDDFCREKKPAWCGYEEGHYFTVKLPDGIKPSPNHMIAVKGGGYWIHFGPTLGNVINQIPFHLDEMFKVNNGKTGNDAHTHSTQRKEVCSVLGVGRFDMTLRTGTLPDGTTPPFAHNNDPRRIKGMEGMPLIKQLTLGPVIPRVTGHFSWMYWPVHCPIDSLNVIASVLGGIGAAYKALKDYEGESAAKDFLSIIEDVEVNEVSNWNDPAPRDGELESVDRMRSVVETRVMIPVMGSLLSLPPGPGPQSSVSSIGPAHGTVMDTVNGVILGGSETPMRATAVSELGPTVREEGTTGGAANE